MLKNILDDVAAELGTLLSSTSERAWLLARVNEAADELYRNNDLYRSDREQLFNVGQTDQQIALPIYVGKLIACRDYDWRITGDIQDMRPRYKSDSWKEPFLEYPYFKWRDKGFSAIQLDITDVAPLTLSTSVPATSNFSIFVTGSTESATRITETVNFVVGDTSKNTVNFFESIESIRKSVVNSEDITVTDMNGRVLATIANSELASGYTLVQVLDRYEQRSEAALVECLYKLKFTPFKNDYDSFPCGDMFDKAIFWKTLSNIWATLDGKELKAQAAAQQSLGIIADFSRNVETNRGSTCAFPKNRIQLATRWIKWYGFRFPWNP